MPASTLGAASFSRSSSGSWARSASKSKVPPARYSQPRPTGGAMVRIESKAPVDAVGAVHLEVRLEPDPLLGDRGAARGRRSTCSPGPAGGCPVAWSTPSAASSSRVQPGEQAGLLREGHLERVDVVRRDPGDVLVHRLGSQLDRTAGHLRGDLGHRDRGLRDGDRLGLGQRDPRGEAPGAVEDHPHREAEVLGVLGALEGAVAHREVLVAVALEPEVRVGDAEVARPLEGDLAEPLVGQRQERRIDLGLCHAHDPSGSRPLRRPTPARWSHGAPCAPRAGRAPGCAARPRG